MTTRELVSKIREEEKDGNKEREHIHVDKETENIWYSAFCVEMDGTEGEQQGHQISLSLYSRPTHQRCILLVCKYNCIYTHRCSVSYIILFDIVVLVFDIRF